MLALVPMKKPGFGYSILPGMPLTRILQVRCKGLYLVTKSEVAVGHTCNPLLICETACKHRPPPQQTNAVSRRICCKIAMSCLSPIFGGFGATKAEESTRHPHQAARIHLFLCRSVLQPDPNRTRSLADATSGPEGRSVKCVPL